MRFVAILIFALLSFVAKTNVCFAQGDPQPEKPAAGKVDFLGDPLPPNAIMRLGTNRFSPKDCCAIARSADGKILVSQGRNSLVGWDAESGRSVWEESHQRQEDSWTGSAAYGFRGICRMHKSGQLVSIGPRSAIKLVDFSTGKEEETLQLDLQETIHSVDVSPNESMFAIGTGKCLLVTDRMGAEKYRIENRPKKSIEARIEGSCF